MQAEAAREGDRETRHLSVVDGGSRRDQTSRTASRPLVSTRSKLIAVVMALCAIGLVMVLSASAWTSLVTYHSEWNIFLHQAAWMFIGLVVFVLVMRVDYDRWRRFSGLLGLLAFLLCTIVLIPHIGVSAGGSSRWIGVGQVRLQPSELMKLAMCVFGADLLTRRAEFVSRARTVVIPLMSWLAFACILLLLQPDMGTAIVVGCITFSLLFAGGVRFWTFVKSVFVVAVVCVIAGFGPHYRRQRLLSFIHPFSQAHGAGYQVVQSLVGIGNGSLAGLGLGAGHEKWGLLPNAHTDFIFSVIGEETGLIGALVVLALFVALGWLGIRASRNAPDRFSMLLAVGITCWIMSQAFINIGAVIDILPVTGIPLPFISFGGSSLVITLAAVGILVNIASHERVRPGRVGSLQVGSDTRPRNRRETDDRSKRARTGGGKRASLTPTSS